MMTRVLLASPRRDVEAAVGALEHSHDVVVLGTVESRPALMLNASRGDIDVIVLDEAFGDASALGTARDLVAEVPEVGIVLLVREPSRAVLSAALHAGVRALSVLPVVPDDLARALSEAAAWSRVVRPRLTPATYEGFGGSGLGMLVVLAGAKGGVGTTTLAVHLALAAATFSSQRHACLVDLDLQSGDVRSLLDLPRLRDFSKLAEAGDRLTLLAIEDQLTLHRSGLRVLLAPADGERAEGAAPGLVRRVLGHLRARFDLVIVDAGGSTTPAAATAVSMADQAVIVLTPDSPALRAARRVLDRWDRRGIRNEGIAVAVNRAARDVDVPEDVIERVLATPLLRSKVPADFASLRDAVNTGLAERLADGPLRATITDLAEELGLLPQKRRSRSASRRSSRSPIATSSAFSEGDQHRAG